MGTVISVMQAGYTKRSFAVAALLAIGCMLAMATVIQSSWLAIGFASFLPQSDTWQHVDALVKSRQGLDLAWLFERHNDVHVLVIPKLVYHADILLTGGDGSVVARTSLIFLLLTPLLVSLVIWRTAHFSRTEKISFIVIGWALLASPMQAESLLNPANLQWSAFALTITLTGLCFSKYLDKRSPYWAALTVLTLVMNALTSASIWLTALPVIGSLLALRYGLRQMMIVLMIGSTLAIASISLISRQELFYINNVLQFFSQYLSPFASKISFAPVSYLASIAGTGLYLTTLLLVYRQQRSMDFFLFLMATLLFIALGIALTRSFMGNGFTFRFMNLPMLCLFSMIVVFYVHTRDKLPRIAFSTGASTLMLGVFSLNTIDTAESMFFRNHLRLTPIAYALDIRHPPLVEELPGYDTGSFDYDDVITEKVKLHKHAIGIYHSEMYAPVGKQIHEIQHRKSVPCRYEIELVTRLGEPPVYGIDGSSYSQEGKIMNHVWITDMDDRVIGMGLPVIHRRTLAAAYLHDKTWTAYLNPALGTPTPSVKAYAYNDTNICQPFSITLPTSP